MPEPTRIALCITDLDVGGAERALVRLATGLDRVAWRVEVFNLSGPGVLSEELRDAGIPCHDLGGRSGRDVRVLWRLYRGLSRFDPAVVQSYLFHANVASRFAGLLAGVPVRVSGLRVAERQSGWHTRLDRWTQSLVSMNVCVSEGVARFSTGPGGLNPAKLSVIANGIDIECFNHVEPAERCEFGIPEKAPVLLGVGRLHAQKGWPVLLQAFESVLAQVPAAHLVIAGDGPERTTLEQWLAGHPAARANTRLLGRRGDVPRLLRMATTFVLSSHWEGMPNVVLEAMAAECPVVATAVEGVPELVTEGVTGLSVPAGDARRLADAITRMLLDPGLRKSCAAAARVRVATQFTWPDVVARYETLYRRLLADRQATS
jgi:glycosyltransferase involved in cell wall biosynthesis